jgi:hypothetical protein
MDFGFLLVFVALLLPIGLYISRPLFEPRSVAVSEAEHRFSALLAERDRILDAIRELDMDNAMGKFTPELYASQRTELVRQGAVILRQLDEVHSIDPHLESDNRLEEALTPVPLAALGEVQIAGAPVPAYEFDYDLENLVSARRQGRQGKAVGFCHRCGHPIQQQDKFCSPCGATA